MSSGLSHLHNVLKDKTRSRIILLLNEKGSLSYTDLMKALEIGSTGTLNYHLKVLEELIAKNEQGQYMLTERGKLASQLLVEFTDRRSQFQKETEMPKWLMPLTMAFLGVYILVVSGLYAAKIIDTSRMVTSIVMVVLFLIFYIAAQKLRKTTDKWSPNRQLLGNKTFKIAFGALLGLLAFLLGGTLLLYGLQKLLDPTGVRGDLVPFFWWAIFCMIAGPITGGLIAYLKFKKSKYANPAYYDAYA